MAPLAFNGQWPDFGLLGERLNIAMSYAEAGEGNLGRLIYDDDLYNEVVLLVEDLRANPWKLLIRKKSKPKSGH